MLEYQLLIKITKWIKFNLFLDCALIDKIFDHLCDIFTDRARSTRAKVIVSLCLSVHTCGGGGLPQPGPASRRIPWWGGGTPPQVPLSHRTWPGGTLTGGYPTSSTPHRTWSGEYPNWGGSGMGVPHLRYPPHQTWLGATLASPAVGPAPTGGGGTPPRTG